MMLSNFARKSGCSVVVESHGKSQNLVRPFFQALKVMEIRSWKSQNDCKVMEYL